MILVESGFFFFKKKDRLYYIYIHVRLVITALTFGVMRDLVAATWKRLHARWLWILVHVSPHFNNKDNNNKSTGVLFFVFLVSVPYLKLWG